MKHLLVVLTVVLVGTGLVSKDAFAQAELNPWGELSGIRIDGQLFRVPTGIAIVGASMAAITRSVKEKYQSMYERHGKEQRVTVRIADFDFAVTVRDTGDGEAALTITAKAPLDTTITGVFACFELPVDYYADPEIAFLDSTASAIEPVSLVPRVPGRTPPRMPMGMFLEQALVKGFRVVSGTTRIEVKTDQPVEMIYQKANPRFGQRNPRIYLGVMLGRTAEGETDGRTFLVRVSGKVDTRPAHIAIDPERPGRAFDGIGGNFRIQNEHLDPKIIDYCLDHLNVRWARVEMPWRSWQPEESKDPLVLARSGKLDDNVRQAMIMAQQLVRRHIPVILSAWYPPNWAIEGEPNFRNENGVFGNPLNPKKMRSIVRSIGDYLVYLKEAYGVEPELFSFNESDLGINVRMTGEEHAQFIKKLGAYLASKELSTKMLLGDNSDATTIDFLQPSLDDPATHQYIGAISFHAWRGCDNWTLANWADAARELNVPLLIAEGGTDAHAWQYPDIFKEPSFAMDEIDIYVRACDIAHVRSILQWQLTADYSLLTGGGVAGTEGPLRPTQRFWNIKQLGTVEPGSFILPLTCDREEVSCAAFGDIADSAFTIHLVNNGASRQVVVSGIPPGVKEFRKVVTDAKRGMADEGRVRVSDGEARFRLDEFAFTSLTSVR